MDVLVEIFGQVVNFIHLNPEDLLLEVFKML